MEQQKITFKAPYKLGDRLRIKSSDHYNWRWPDRAFYVIGNVVAILEKDKEIPEDLLMHYYGRLMPGTKKVNVDRIVLQKDNGYYTITPYRPERFDFTKVEDLDYGKDGI